MLLRAFQLICSGWSPNLLSVMPHVGEIFGVSVGASVARARSMFRHCVFRLRFCVIAFRAAAPFRCSSLVYDDSCMVGGIGWEVSVHVFTLMGLERV